MLSDSEIELFELEVLQRRTTGMLFRFFEKIEGSNLLKLPVSRTCGLTTELLNTPIRNLNCALPTCVFELEILSLTVMTKCNDGKTIPCPLCKRKITLSDYCYDLDLAYYTKKFADLPQDVQILVDRKGQFTANEGKNPENYENALKKVRPMNPCTPEQLDLDFMTNSINDLIATLEIAKSNLARFSQLFECPSIEMNTTFEESLIKLVGNGIKVNQISKSQRQKLFTFWITAKNQLHLYYPAFDNWLRAQLIKPDGSTFNVHERTVAIMAKNGNIYLIGGTDDGCISKDLYEIQVNPVEGSHSQKFIVVQKESMPDERIFFCYCQLDNKLYIIMGLYTDWQVRKDLQRETFIYYDIATNKWGYLNSSKYPRAFGAAYATPNQKIYLFSGLDISKGTNSNSIRYIEEYDIHTNEWTDLGLLTELTLINEKIELKQMPAMFCQNNKNLIIFGGNYIDRNKSRGLTQASISATINYNLGTKTIISGEPLPSKLKIDFGTSFPYNYAIFNKKVYIYVVISDVHVCLVYDISKNSWELKPKINQS